MRGERVHKGKGCFSLPFRLLLGLVYLAFLISYGVALLSPVVSPLTSHIPALFNLAFGLILLALVFFLVYFLWHLRKSGLLLVIHLLLIAFTVNYLTTYFPLNVAEGLTDAKELRVMTYNVERFAHRLSKDSSPYAVSVIHKYKPDILCIQESPNLGSRQKTAKWYRDSFPKEEYPYMDVCNAKGLVLLSKYPLREARMVEYESYTNGTMSYLIDVKGETLLLVNNHLESYGLTREEKSKYKEYIKDPDANQLMERFKEVTRRLYPNMNLRVNAALSTRRDVDRTLREQSPEMVLILGDFNDTPMSYAYSVLRGRDMKDAFQQVGFGPGISYNERLFPFRIDHVLYKGGLKAVGGDIPWLKEASDHNPVIIDFKLD